MKSTPQAFDLHALVRHGRSALSIITEFCQAANLTQDAADGPATTQDAFSTTLTLRARGLGAEVVVCGTGSANGKQEAKQQAALTALQALLALPAYTVPLHNVLRRAHRDMQARQAISPATSLPASSGTQPRPAQTAPSGPVLAVPAMSATTPARSSPHHAAAAGVTLRNPVPSVPALPAVSATTPARSSPHQATAAGAALGNPVPSGPAVPAVSATTPARSPANHATTASATIGKATHAAAVAATSPSGREDLQDGELKMTWQDLVLRHLGPGEAWKTPMSILQERCAVQIEQVDSDHMVMHRPWYTMAVTVTRPGCDLSVRGEGTGNSKQEAKQEAAGDCLKKLLLRPDRARDMLGTPMSVGSVLGEPGATGDLSEYPLCRARLQLLKDLHRVDRTPASLLNEHCQVCRLDWVREDQRKLGGSMLWAHNLSFKATDSLSGKLWRCTIVLTRHDGQAPITGTAAAGTTKVAKHMAAADVMEQVLQEQQQQTQTQLSQDRQLQRAKLAQGVMPRCDTTRAACVTALTAPAAALPVIADAPWLHTHAHRFPCTRAFLAKPGNSFKTPVGILNDIATAKAYVITYAEATSQYGGFACGGQVKDWKGTTVLAAASTADFTGTSAGMPSKKSAKALAAALLLEQLKPS